MLLILFQVDPRCVIQYLHWYHEDIYGEKRLLKTSKNSNDPYLHTIYDLKDTDLGRYICIIENVVGKTECTAYLSVRSGATAPGGGGAFFDSDTFFFGLMPSSVTLTGVIVAVSASTAVRIS